MVSLLRFGLPFLFLIPACASPNPGADRSDFGVLLMAHGGAQEWNDGVLEAVRPLGDEFHVAVAFGMADAVSIQQAVDELEAKGVSRIGVVRLFVSGESWYERTLGILGLRPGAPDRPAPAQGDHRGGHGEHAGHRMEFWRVDTRSAFALSTQGLAEAEGVGPVLADRVGALSSDPRREDVLILAHGPGDDGENQRWLARIDARADAVRASLPFRRVAVMTLREDWPQKRVQAEERIRAFVARAREEGGTAIVVPFRVHGFGPYAEVLEGLDYVADGQGLIPHARVTGWIAEQARSLARGPFRSPAARTVGL